MTQIIHRYLVLCSCAQPSRNQPHKQKVLGKCRPSRWNSILAFKTWALLANKRRKDIPTSSLVICCSLFTLKKGNQPRPPRLIEPFARNCSERNASLHAMCDTQHTFQATVSIPYCSHCHGVTPYSSRRQHSQTRWLAGQSTGHSFNRCNWTFSSTLF